jgi:hypothetical protein
MPVSPVDPSHSPSVFRFLEQLHALELRCKSVEEVSLALGQLSQQQAQQASTALSSLTGEPPRELLLQDSHLGKRLFDAAEAQKAAYESLTRPYDVMLREMAIQGRGALTNGIRLEGREKIEELKDALKLLQGVLNHPIGSRNFAVWYEVGWLQWQLGEPLQVAADSFYHAVRLARNNDPLYHLGALRHQAYLMAGQGLGKLARSFWA